VNVATRITMATAVVVAIASATYAGFDLRARVAERRMTIEREARSVAGTLRVSLETQPSAFRQPSVDLVRDLERAASGWKVTVIPRARAVETSSDELIAVQLRRLRTLLDVPQLSFADVEAGQYFFALPIRAAASTPRDEPQVLGMLEISRSADTIGATSSDLARAVILVLLIVVVTTVMVGALASRLVSRPITKLLRGIDDVAKGDLSHVILSERDDEIGAIATRFNEMTYSLRESRAETQRQNDEKLQLEQRLGQTEKLATIGQLAAEIAHEVGTPLNVIAGRARSRRRRRTPRRSRRTPRSSPSRPRGSPGSSSACSTSPGARSARPSARRSTSTISRRRRSSCSPGSSRSPRSRPSSTARPICPRSPATPIGSSRC
jgi:HAMP domain-containing protein